MNIDWSKAPEGTTHFHPNVNGYVEHWVKINGGKSWFCVTNFEKEGWKQDFGKLNTKDLVAIPDITAEELSAKQLEKAIEQIQSDLNCTAGMAKDIYMAGYRKFEIVEEDV